MSKTQLARYNIGQVIRRRVYEMRGVIFDVDAAPDRSQGADPASDGVSGGLVYRLLAEHEHVPYVACIAEHELLPDLSGHPVTHPKLGEMFDVDEQGAYRCRLRLMN
jgi:heat shock protein HspQ